MHLQSFINGLSIGILMGVLFAPEKGEETRRRILRKGSTIKDNVKDTYEDIADNISDQIGQVKNKANQILNRGQKNITN